MACALEAETKEEEYLAMIERHKAGVTGRRGCDLMGQMFGELVNTMGESDADILVMSDAADVPPAKAFFHCSPRSRP